MKDSGAKDSLVVPQNLAVPRTERSAFCTFGGSVSHMKETDGVRKSWTRQKNYRRDCCKPWDANANWVMSCSCSVFSATHCLTLLSTSSTGAAYLENVVSIKLIQGKSIRQAFHRWGEKKELSQPRSWRKNIWTSIWSSSLCPEDVSHQHWQYRKRNQNLQSVKGS